MGNYFSIKEMARMRNVTTETLRHYDRIGLFKPSYVDPNSRYRYYSSNQFEILGTIIELKQLGMSLEDIKEYFENRNLQKSIDILENQYARLKKDIQEKLILEKILKRKLDFTKTIIGLDPNFEPSIKEFKHRYAIAGETFQTDGKKVIYAMTELEALLNDKAPVLASDRMGFYTNENIFEYDDYKEEMPYAPIIICLKEEATKIKKKLFDVPSGEYACIYYRRSAIIPKPRYEKLKEFISQNNYEVCGNIYIQYIIDATLTDNLQEKLIEMQVPVKKKMED